MDSPVLIRQKPINPKQPQDIQNPHLKKTHALLRYITAIG